MLEDPKRFPKAECVGCSRSTGFTWLFQWLYSWGKGNKRWVDCGAEGRNRIVAYMLHLRNFFFWVCGNASPTKQVTSWAKVRGRDPDLSLQIVVLKWSLQCCFINNAPWSAVVANSRSRKPARITWHSWHSPEWNSTGCVWRDMASTWQVFSKRCHPECEALHHKLEKTRWHFQCSLYFSSPVEWGQPCFVYNPQTAAPGFSTRL